MKTARNLTALVLLLLTLGLATYIQAQPGTIVDVDISGFAFAPQNITVEIGTTVRWTNQDAMAHTSTSDDGLWDSGLLANGEQFMQTFLATGVFDYHCTPHPSMTGTITVESTGPETLIDITGLSFPANTIVEIGTVVTWKNSHIVPHTSTSNDGVWDSGTLNNGDTFSFLFTATGSYPYTCLFHTATMNGVITVNSTGPATSVDIPGLSFNPQDITIEMNTVVTWTNSHAVTHTTTSDDGVWDSGNMGLGDDFSFLFITPGFFPYHCTIHPMMTGSVTVNPPPPSIVCGDLDNNGDVNVLDIVFYVNWKFKGGPAPGNLDAADVNNDAAHNVLDIVAMVNFKFKSGPALTCP